MQKLVLFDIDGTLLLSGGAGRRALIRVLAATIGDEGVFDRVRFDGKTDPQIIAELLREAGHAAGAIETLIDPLGAEYLRLLERELTAIDAPRPTLMPGVVEVLDRLEANAAVALGLLTGNIAAGAALKLRAAGLDPARFRVAAYGSDSAHRPDLPAIAAQRARTIFGRVPGGKEVVIVGDTPADMTCGQAIGARAIGVATGSYTVEDLRLAGAADVFDDLSDVERAVASMLA